MTAINISATANDPLKPRFGIAACVSVVAHLLFLGGAGLWARHAAPIIAETSPNAAQVTLLQSAEKTPLVPPTDTPAVAPVPSPTPTPVSTPRPAPSQSPVTISTPQPTPITVPVSAFANAPASFPYAATPLPSAPRSATPTPPPLPTPAPMPFAPPQPPPAPAPAPKTLGFTRAAQIIALQNPDLPGGLRTGDAKISLRVRLDVDANGSVSGVTLQSSSGNPEIDKRATDTLMHAKFVPAFVNGTPTASTYPFTFTF